MICLWAKAKRELPDNYSAEDLQALGKICHEKCPKPCGAENDNCVITYKVIFSKIFPNYWPESAEKS